MDNAKLLVELLSSRGLSITTVESCTGGALANALTDIPGASDVFRDGFITYSNEAKIALGVPEQTIRDHSVYSDETAIAMAQAGRKQSAVKPAIAVGITGSLSRVDPANAEASVVGVAYVAIVHGDKIITKKLDVPPALPRPEAKQYIVEYVLKKLLETLR